MIPVFKPQHVRWLPKPITLWAVWEGVDGKHHEQAEEYTDPMETVQLRNGWPLRTYYTSKHPLLTSNYREDPEQVLPDTLRFIRIEDVTKLYRYVLKTGETFVFHWDGYTPGGAVYDRMRTLNGFEISQEDLTFAHIIYPRHIDQNNHLEPDEWNHTGKDNQ